MSCPYFLPQAPVNAGDIDKLKMATRTIGWEPRDPPARSSARQDPPSPQPTAVPSIAVSTPTLECSSHAESRGYDGVTMHQSSTATSNGFQRPRGVDPRVFGEHSRQSNSVHQPKLGESCLRVSPPALALSTRAAGAAPATKSHRIRVCSRGATLGLSEPAVASRRQSQPETRERLVVTRSGRRSIPVLDLLPTRQSSLGRKAKGAHSAGLSEQNGPRKRSRRSRLEEKATSQFCSDESLLLEEPTSCDRRRVRVDGVVDAAADGEKAAATPEHEKVSEDLTNLTRSGRRWAPVLDWWRNQRLPHAPDGKVVAVSSEPSEDVNSPRTFAVAKAVDLDGVEASDGEDSPWTKPQLHSLRVAQMDTVPSATDFWGAVSSKVKGRGPQQCQQKWFELFAAPKVRRGKAGSKCHTSRETETPVASKAFSLSQENLKAADSSPSLTENLPWRADGDDLFQSTPMRGRSRFGVQLGDDAFEAKTPRTPAGPGAPFADASAAANASGDGRADYERGVSRTYVQAISKKMRKAHGASQMCSNRVVLQGKAGTKQPSAGAGRTIHAATASRGHLLKASMATSGVVRVESTGSGDSGDEVGFSDDVESDGE